MLPHRSQGLTIAGALCAKVELEATQVLQLCVLGLVSN